jgi:hypothetical protein
VHKTYTLYRSLHTSVEQWPKRQQYTIGQRAENITLEILELLYVANSKKGGYRLANLKTVDVKLKILRVMIRLAYDLQALDQKKYLALQERLQEIGKMLGGWIKSTASE